jgi:hypothetical protein
MMQKNLENKREINRFRYSRMYKIMRQDMVLFPPLVANHYTNRYVNRYSTHRLMPVPIPVWVPTHTPNNNHNNNHNLKTIRTNTKQGGLDRKPAFGNDRCAVDENGQPICTGYINLQNKTGQQILAAPWRVRHIKNNDKDKGEQLILLEIVGNEISIPAGESRMMFYKRLTTREFFDSSIQIYIIYGNKWDDVRPLSDNNRYQQQQQQQFPTSFSPQNTLRVYFGKGETITAKNPTNSINTNYVRRPNLPPVPPPLPYRPRQNI